MTQIVEKIETGRFNVFWTEKPTEIIKLDFNPLVDYFNYRQKPIILVHWQAIPLELRRYGAYNCRTDEYICFDWDKATILNTKCRLLQIPDAVFKIRPTAVLAFEGDLKIDANKVVNIAPYR